MAKLVLSGSPTFNSDGSCAINSTGSDLVRGPPGNINSTQLWVAVRAKLAFASTDTTNRRFFTWGPDTNNELYLEWMTTSLLGCGRDAGGTAEVSITPGAFSAGSSHTMIGRWSATGMSASFDGSAFVAEFLSASLPTIPSSQPFDIGVRAYTPANWTESDFYWVAIGVGALTDADAATLHAFGDSDPAFVALPAAPVFLWAANDAVFTEGEGGRAPNSLTRSALPLMPFGTRPLTGDISNKRPPTGKGVLGERSTGPSPWGGFERDLALRLHPVVLADLVRSATDTLGTSDSATRSTQTFTRTASETLGTTDQATNVSGLFASDTFTDTVNTVLTSHTPDTGGNYTLSSNSTGTAHVTALKRAGSTSAGTAIYLNNGTPLLQDYAVQGVVSRTGATGVSTQTAGIAARLVNDDGYGALISANNGIPVLFLLRIDAGVFTTLDSVIVPDQPNYALRLVVGLGTQTLYLDDADILNGTDTTYSATGKSGLLFGADDGFWEIDGFTGGVATPAVTVRTASDTLGTSDVATRAVQTFTRSATDSLGTTDAATRSAQTFTRTATDTLATSDAATRAVETFTRSASETLGTSDAATRSAQVFTRTATDTLGTSDVATRSQTFTRTASDTLATSDAATRTAQTFTRSVTDTLGTSDAATRSSQTLTRTATETLGTGDAATRTAQTFTRTATDTFGTSDVATRTEIFTRAATDALGTSDTATRTAQVFTRSATDTLGTSDSATRIVTFLRSASETLGTTDAATRTAQTFTRTASDTLGTSDAATSLGSFPRGASDSLGTSDVATRGVQSFTRSATDTLGTSDDATRLLVFSRSASDSLGTSDDATTANILIRTASDTLGTTDSATRLLTFSRTTSDTLGTSDAATRGAQTFTRSATETLATSDAATRIVSRTRSAAEYLGGVSAHVRANANAWFRVGEPSGSVAADSQGAASGTYVGSPTLGVTGLVPADTAVTFNGSSQYVDIPFQDIEHQSLAAVEIYVSYSTAASNLFLWSESNTANANPILAISISGGAVRFFRRSNSGINDSAAWDQSTTKLYNNSSRHHIVLNKNGTTYKVYVDGVLEITATPAAGIFTLTTETLAALHRTSVANFWPGTADELAFYLRELTDTEIAMHAALGGSGTSDAATRTFSISRAATETLATSDSATRTVQIARSASDTLGTTDAATRTAQTFTRTATDALGTSDAATRSSQTSTRSASDTLATDDAATRTLTSTRTASDALGTDDVATRLLSQTRSTSETLGTSDVATRDAQVFTRSTTDALATTDAATRVVSFTRSASDSLGTSDAAARAPITFTRSVSDSLGTSDDASTGNIAFRSATDSLGTTDDATRSAQSFTRSASDGLGTSDNATRLVSVTRSASETLATSDVATRVAQAFTRTASDSLATSDAASRTTIFIRSASDSLGTSDDASAANNQSTATDTLGTTDTATRAAQTFTRSSADTLATTDLATRSVALARAAFDVVTTTDAATVQFSQSRSASDTLSTSDTATRAYVAIRFASDLLSTSDSAERAVFGIFATDTLGTSDVAISFRPVRVRPVRTSTSLGSAVVAHDSNDGVSTTTSTEPVTSANRLRQ